MVRISTEVTLGQADSVNASLSCLTLLPAQTLCSSLSMMSKYIVLNTFGKKSNFEANRLCNEAR